MLGSRSIIVNIESKEFNREGTTTDWWVRATYDNLVTIDINTFDTFEEAVEYATEKYPNAKFKIEGFG